MKLTPELLLHAPSYINAIRDRELDLRGILFYVGFRPYGKGRGDLLRAVIW